jgi:hypothetical protein
MSKIQRLFQEAKAVMIIFRMAFAPTSISTCLVQVSMLILLLLPCVVVSQNIDTSEQGMNKWFQERMCKSDIIVDAQVISKESKWDSSKGGRGIYTTIKFKVFQTIKGAVENNEITFDQLGGMVGNQKRWLSNSMEYNLNRRKIYFFTKKFAEVDREEIAGGAASVGHFRVSAKDYINTIKRSVTDTTAFQKYYHGFKQGEEDYRTGALKVMKGPWPKAIRKDSVNQEYEIRKSNSDTTRGGLK